MADIPNNPPVRRTLALMGAIAFMEPISATMLFPFVYFMVRDFNPEDQQHIRLRAGLITSAFFVPQMITTIPARPAIDNDYVFRALDLGNGERGQLALSYFNREGGGYAVGTRETLSKAHQSSKIEACHDTFRTLTRIQPRWNVPLQFELQNPCFTHDHPGQVHLGP